ncbi:MAG TPA: hypothetical protein VFY39_15430 [Gammaproteobacteria bacterium]|nr:hypothetical protein [Gammaproteobacteria bacterium]
MTAVLRLMLTYFTGTPLSRGITGLGLLGVAGGCGALLYLPPLVGQSGGPSRFSLAQEAVLTLLPVAGVLCVALGASLLPTLVARLASSHYLYVLPQGRTKVLVSVFATITLVALVAAGGTTVYYVRTPLALDVVFARGFVVALLTYSLLYVVVWVAGRASGPIGLLVGSIAVIVTLVLPLRIIASPSRSYLALWIVLALAWASFAAAFMLAPRLGPAIRRIAQNTANALERSSYLGGGEIDFLIGTARPWTFALGQVVPILLATYFLRGFGRIAPSAMSPWLFFLVILSILSGGTASRAAMRSRALWLRTGWSRAELFKRVEAAFWRHNSYSLGVLLVMLVALGAYYYLPAKMLVAGLGLLGLGTALSTYLGLMTTARIGWIEAVVANTTMLALMAAALYATAPSTSVPTLLALEGALAALVPLFRHFAARRWRRLDWMRCRAEPDVRAAA